MQTQPDRIAMRMKDYGIWHDITWAQYYQNVKKVAMGLHSIGVKRGDQDWLNFVNTALHEAMTGVEFDFYANSYKTWFGKDLTPPQIGFPVEYK